MKKKTAPRTEHQLPGQFQDLAPYLAWSLPTERERSAKRQASTMAEIKALYDALLPRMEEVLPYLAQFPPENIPVDVQNLFYRVTRVSRLTAISCFPTVSSTCQRERI